MKLIGKLKNQVEAAESLEEKKPLIADAGMKLTDDELATVAGGSFFRQCYCPTCKQVFWRPTSLCPLCGGHCE